MRGRTLSEQVRYAIFDVSGMQHNRQCVFHGIWIDSICCYVGSFVQNLNANREGARCTRLRRLYEAHIPCVQLTFYARWRPR